MEGIVSRRRKALTIKMRDELSLDILSKKLSDQYCDIVFLLDFTWVDFVLLLSSYGSCMPSLGQKVNIKFSHNLSPQNRHQDDPQTWHWKMTTFFNVYYKKISWTRQLLGRQVLEQPLVQLEEMLCLCSPVTGCVSAGVWSTALEQTEVHERLLDRTWTAGQRRGVCSQLH